MNFRWDKKYLYWGLTAFLVIVSSIVFFFAIFRYQGLSGIWGTLMDILKPIFYGIIIAYFLTPVVNFFDRHLWDLWHRIKPKQQLDLKKKKIVRSFSILLTMVLVLCLLVAIISMIVPQVIESISGFANEFPNYLDRFSVWLNHYLENEPQLAQAANKLFEKIGDNYDQWWENLRPALNSFVTGLTIGLVGAVTVLKNILIGFIVSIYVLYSKDIFAAQAKKIVYAVLEIGHGNRFISVARHTHQVFSGFIVGKLIDSLIIGIICFVGMTLLGLPMPMLISVIIGVTNIIPFFGPFIGAIPCTIILLLINPMSWQWLYFVLFILALQQFDGNILGPKILGESTGLSCFWVICSILVAGGLFGFAGMVMGVPFFAVIYGGVRSLIERSLKKKGLPVKTQDYKGMEYIDEKTKNKVDTGDPMKKL